MIYDCRLRQLPGFPTLHTERMFNPVVLPKMLPPSGVIEFGNPSVSMACIILFVHDFLMLRTVPTIRKICTAGIRTWPFRFIGHNNRDRKEKEEYKEKYFKAIEVIGKKEMEIELLKKEQLF